MPGQARKSRPRRTLSKTALERLLGARGPLAQRLPGFVPRPQQIALAQSVGEALDRGRPCLAEAGTGVGKTLAYLVPLVRWLEGNEARAIVSTHTIGLQSQLVERDIPALLGALESPIEAAVLKGRRNYLCLQELDISAAEPWAAADPVFQSIKAWAGRTETGDHADLDRAVPFWTDIAANADTCRGRECRHYDRCFFYRARRIADDARLIVVNHALFFADLRLKAAAPGAPGLLPAYDAVVFDEAHHVEETASRSFGTEWISGGVPRLLARCRRVDGLEPGLLALIETQHARLVAPILARTQGEKFLREVLRNPADRSDFAALRTELRTALDRLSRDLVRIADSADEAVAKDRAAGLARIATRSSTELAMAAPDEDDDDAFHWVQARTLRSGNPQLTFTRTPYSVAEPIAGQLLDRIPRSIFVSATLATLGTFEIARRRLGVDERQIRTDPIESLQGSPFDTRRNCLLYVPRRLGPPSPSDDYARKTLDEIHALLQLSRGRAFVLFTSHRMLALARDAFRDALPWKLHVQGDLPPARLVEAFAADGNAVLLATGGFWEGVDVPGEALSMVIIDKLPFAIPDSPPQRAREERLRREGRDPFAEWSLPSTSLRLKQGFGRLLRTTTDRGVVAVLDARLWSRDYGRTLLDDLPDCPRTDSREDVATFFNV
ncbi:MAG: ATP-dependent DNA helicase [Armatimonadota bacterium]